MELLLGVALGAAAASICWGYWYTSTTEPADDPCHCGAHRLEPDVDGHLQRHPAQPHPTWHTRHNCHAVEEL
jgi:hypothetical protein